MIGVSPSFGATSNIWANKGAISFYSYGEVLTGDGTTFSRKNINMPFKGSGRVGVKLDMNNKQLTFYLGTKTHTETLTHSSYKLFVTSGSSQNSTSAISFKIIEDPNLFVYNHGLDL